MCQKENLLTSPDEMPVKPELTRGQLFRHQDGGIYRYLATSLHTDDKAELIIYEHVWPFDAGQVWARPAHEWPSRFTAITPQALQDAQRQPRQEAQASVMRAKAKRRAMELTTKKASV